jgi:hypothetical protein
MVIVETEDQQEMATRRYSQVRSWQDILESYEKFHTSLSTLAKELLFEERRERGGRRFVQLTRTIQIESQNIKGGENESIPFVTS